MHANIASSSNEGQDGGTSQGQEHSEPKGKKGPAIEGANKKRKSKGKEDQQPATAGQDNTEEVEEMLKDKATKPRGKAKGKAAGTAKAKAKPTATDKAQQADTVEPPIKKSRVSKAKTNKEKPANDAAGAASSATDQAGAEAVQEKTTNDGEGGYLKNEGRGLEIGIPSCKFAHTWSKDPT